MPDESSRGHGPGEQSGCSPVNGPRPGRRGRVPDGPRPGAGGHSSAGGPLPADRQPVPGARAFAVVPGDLDGDGWDQDAAMAEFLADLEAGYDLFAAPVGLEPDELDELDVPFAGGEGGWPGADGAAGPAGEPAAGDRPVGDPGGGGVPPAGGGAGPGVAEFLDAGSLPRGAAWPDPSRGSGSGFASGDVLDVALPDPGLAGLADAAASGGVGVGRSYARLSDDELIGVLGGWRKTEAWAAAGRLSAVAELISRRPAEPSGDPGTADGPTVGPNVLPDDVTAASDGPAASGHAGDGAADGDHAEGGSASLAAGDGPAARDHAGSGGPGASKGPGGGARRTRFRPGGESSAPMSWRWRWRSPGRPRNGCWRWPDDLATRLPLTARALHEGVIDAYKAQIIAEATRVLDDAAAAAAEAAIFGAGLRARHPGRSASRRPRGPPGRSGRGPETAGAGAEGRAGGVVAGGCGDGGVVRVRAAAGCGAGRRPADPGPHDRPEGGRGARQHGSAAGPRLPRRPARPGHRRHHPRRYGRRGRGRPGRHGRRHDGRPGRHGQPGRRCGGRPGCPRPTGGPRSRTRRGARDGQRPRGRDAPPYG